MESTTKLVWGVLCIVLSLHVKHSLADVVCHVGGTSCPANTCCNQSTCDTEGVREHCCSEDEREDDAFCSNCPTCVQCTWAAWGEWSYQPCEKEGKEAETVTGIRHRKHDNPGNGAPCPGEAQETGSKDCPVVECETNKDCSNGQVCNNAGTEESKCEAPCKTDTDCPKDHVCNNPGTEEAKCVPDTCTWCTAAIVIASILVLIAVILVLMVLRKKKMWCFDTGIISRIT